MAADCCFAGTAAAVKDAVAQQEVAQSGGLEEIGIHGGSLGLGQSGF